MGETTELIMEGHLCEHCGVYLNTKGIEGFPQTCRGCMKDLRKRGGKFRDVGNGHFQDITPIKKTRT